MQHCSDVIANSYFLSDFIELLVTKTKCKLYFVLWLQLPWPPIHKSLLQSVRSLEPLKEMASKLKKTVSSKFTIEPFWTVLSGEED